MCWVIPPASPAATSVLTVRYGQTYFDGSWGNPAFGKDQVISQLGIQGGFLDRIYSQEGCQGQFPKISVPFGMCPVVQADTSVSRFYAPHLVNLNLIYRTRGRSKTLAGWTASMATILRSGFPLVITQNESPLGAYGFSHQRPENALVSAGGDPITNFDRYVIAGSLEPTVGLRVSDAPPTTDSVRSPSLINWDVSLEKTTTLVEDVTLSVRFEFINQLNNVNWHGPRTVFGSDSFASIPGTRGFPRTSQMMTKIVF